MTTIDVHRAGERIRAESYGPSAWLEIPLSDDRTALLSVYLTPTQCRRLAAELIAVADLTDRRTAAMRQEMCQAVGNSADDAKRDGYQPTEIR